MFMGAVIAIGRSRRANSTVSALRQITPQLQRPRLADCLSIRSFYAACLSARPAGHRRQGPPAARAGEGRRKPPSLRFAAAPGTAQTGLASTRGIHRRDCPPVGAYVHPRRGRHSRKVAWQERLGQAGARQPRRGLPGPRKAFQASQAGFQARLARQAQKGSQGKPDWPAQPDSPQISPSREISISPRCHLNDDRLAKHRLL